MSKAAYSMPPSVHGYDGYELMSALQKAIRRGLEEDAMTWAWELGISNMGNFLFARLEVICMEDVGLGDIASVMFSLDCINLARGWYKDRAKSNRWAMATGNAIRALCRAEKSREGDHFQAAIRGRVNGGELPKIPDYALDKHTRRGKKMGRGLDHFRKEGAFLDKIAYDDPYIDEAFSVWEWEERQKKESRAGGALFQSEEGE